MSKRSWSQVTDQRIDQLSMDAPMLPTNRPPTKKEVWDRFNFIYQDIKEHGDLARFCRNWWCWAYVDWVNRKAWRKQPDWVDGDTVIYEAVPSKPFGPDEGAWIREVNRLFEIAKGAKAIASERRAA